MTNICTRSDMAHRWGVSRQVVDNWSKRHSDFPIVKTRVDNGRMPIYTVESVFIYERKRNLEVKSIGGNFDGEYESEKER